MSTMTSSLVLVPQLAIERLYFLDVAIGAFVKMAILRLSLFLFSVQVRLIVAPVNMRLCKPKNRTAP